ncbi:NADP-dependent oxidoreductase [Hoeflea sp. YIM 152468]|uniref:NADP-dependent oxidoreductase n=1 Tax=Hoeflea sp. YIM 152468 TaxID=3031759 RepID=UPI0023DB1C64|nr:NADP-dependent oxidoreductase [Hoeflea sp. YIM 152468]MDF1608512.1 NADP-dependent oxidoreductase [Hoeflea sp. YIM 152468]
MKAAIIKNYAADIEISEVPKPVPDADSVLVQVHAASLNPIDNIVRAGHMKDIIPLSFPHVMGYDLSGVISKVGTNVSGLKPGDAVYARPNQTDAGSLAEFALVQADELALKPTGLSHAEAASIPLAGLTAWQALIDKAGLKAGQKILIHAGSGGVGTLAIQLAKHIGAHVATTTSASNADLVRSLGADEVIDYKTQTFEDVVSDYDVVLDMLGGDTMKRSFAVLKKGGILVSIKGQDGDNLAEKHGVRFAWFLMSPSGEQLRQLGVLIDKGIVKPVIDSSFELDEVSQAYDRLADGHAAGKIVVAIR